MKSAWPPTIITVQMILINTCLQGRRYNEPGFHPSLLKIGRVSPPPPKDLLTIADAHVPHTRPDNIQNFPAPLISLCLG